MPTILQFEDQAEILGPQAMPWRPGGAPPPVVGTQ